MIHALCVVQTVSLHKIAAAMPTAVERDSNLRRVQRFLAHYSLNLDCQSNIRTPPSEEGIGAFDGPNQLEVR